MTKKYARRDVMEPAEICFCQMQML